MSSIKMNPIKLEFLRNQIRCGSTSKIPDVLRCEEIEERFDQIGPPFLVDVVAADDLLDGVIAEFGGQVAHVRLGPFLVLEAELDGGQTLQLVEDPLLRLLTPQQVQVLAAEYEKQEKTRTLVTVLLQLNGLERKGFLFTF